MATGIHLVYHGTCLDHARSIWQHGIDLSKQRPMTDFGQGFYTTTQWKQATLWAARASQRFEMKTHQASPPAILVFTIDPTDWRRLLRHSFRAWPLSDPTGSLFVSTCRRASKLIHSYDFVYGPVYRPPWKSPVPATGEDQLSVHTKKAITLLEKGSVGIWTQGGNRTWSNVTP